MISFKFRKPLLSESLLNKMAIKNHIFKALKRQSICNYIWEVCQLADDVNIKANISIEFVKQLSGKVEEASNTIGSYSSIIEFNDIQASRRFLLCRYVFTSRKPYWLNLNVPYLSIYYIFSWITPGFFVSIIFWGNHDLIQFSVLPRLTSLVIMF